MFLISSRPLSFSEYLLDPRIIEETQIPPLLELDTLYFYIQGNKGDTSGVSGELNCIEILDIQIKDMEAATEEGHALLIDAGHTKYHLNFDYRYQLEQWREALLCSVQTAREAKLSITGKSKNISLIMSEFYKCPHSAKDKIQKKYINALQGNVKFRQIDTLTEVCSTLEEDMLVTFDACMA